VILNVDIIWQSLNLGKSGLVLRFSSLGVGLGNGKGVLSRVDKRKFVVLDGDFPDGGIEGI